MFFPKVKVTLFTLQVQLLALGLNKKIAARIKFFRKNLQYGKVSIFFGYQAYLIILDY